MNNTLKKLEDWEYKHKARSVRITHDDGYGASCWFVELWHEHGKTEASDSDFYNEAQDMMDENYSWERSLETIIELALKRFEEGKWKPKQKFATSLPEKNHKSALAMTIYIIVIVTAIYLLKIFGAIV